ncbi:MAG: radical SAM family heme chaperone HemW [bacterium]|nr:radical SAM family heme chaperone HemW [bacterium]
MQLGIYIHIPFCLKKCNYCDFISYADKSSLMNEYIESVIQEINQIKASLPFIPSSIYFGGGTPSLVPPEQIARIIAELFGKGMMNQPPPLENVEITLEANPGTVDVEKLKQYKQAGVNRISLGVQSFDKTVLTAMGRVHSVEDNFASFQFARDAEFDNINLDLIFGYPGQTLQSWQETVEHTVTLLPEHISAYNITVEPNTNLYHQLKSGQVKPIDEEVELEMYQYAIDIFQHAGYVHYEISNFALPGPDLITRKVVSRQCQHNLNYWNDNDYLGFGASAHSYLNGERSWNVHSLEEYIQRIKSGHPARAASERLEGKQKMAEYSMLALRTMQGLDLKKFQQKFQKEFREVFDTELPELFESGLLQQTDQYLRLTDKGILLSNEVFSQLF